MRVFNVLIRSVSVYCEAMRVFNLLIRSVSSYCEESFSFHNNVLQPCIKCEI